MKHLQTQLTDQEWVAFKTAVIRRDTTLSNLLRALVLAYLAGRLVPKAGGSVAEKAEASD